MTDQDLADTYLPAFASAVTQGRVSSIMCSYNAVNGVPSCANSFLMRDIAQTEWGFNSEGNEGYITSDCDGERPPPVRAASAIPCQPPHIRRVMRS